MGSHPSCRPNTFGSAFVDLSSTINPPVFKKSFGVPLSAYLTERRMARAKTLLANTDYPVSVVAAFVGYDDASAFTRRFHAHHGQSPRAFARRS